jgi:hypothetical protein
VKNSEEMSMLEEKLKEVIVDELKRKSKDKPP